MSEKVADSSARLAGGRQGYFAGAVDELKKVQTPTRQETTRLTGVVLLIIVFISMCLFVMDLTFNWLMSKMIGQ